jgi:hypothetical protein
VKSRKRSPTFDGSTSPTQVESSPSRRRRAPLTGSSPLARKVAPGGVTQALQHARTSAGGRGAEVGGDFSLNAGEVLQIAVGGEGGAGSIRGGGGGSISSSERLSRKHRANRSISPTAWSAAPSNSPPAGERSSRLLSRAAGRQNPCMVSRTALQS